ncbi:hypothetical protein [Chroococcidiopsis sp [FACHB-1243]]|nr:hypothetical protein [Chroococcidiopsis sp. [FACHB-1243]]
MAIGCYSPLSPLSPFPTLVRAHSCAPVPTLEKFWVKMYCPSAIA